VLYIQGWESYVSKDALHGYPISIWRCDAQACLLRVTSCGTEEGGIRGDTFHASQHFARPGASERQPTFPLTARTGYLLPTAVRAQRHVRGVSVAVSSSGGNQRSLALTCVRSQTCTTLRSSSRCTPRIAISTTPAISVLFRIADRTSHPAPPRCPLLHL
jgi:hypothetical protein